MSFLLVCPHHLNIQPYLICSTPPPLQSHYNFSRGHLWPLLFFLNMYLRKRPNSSVISRSYAISLFSHRGPLKGIPISYAIKLFFDPFSSRLHLDGFLYSQVTNGNQVWNTFIERLVTSSPAATLVWNNPSATLRDIPASLTRHLHSFCPILLWSGPLSTILFSYFWIG